VFEAAVMHDELSACIVRGESEGMLRQRLIEAEMVPLRLDVLQKVAQGICDFDEAMGVHWLT
jgi:type II secretory ATPase GspE/PulE/Tfp pilus assembly ATPase PilB-like protein